MNRGLLKLDPTSDDEAERDFDLAYYRSLTVAQRFRMVVERSILLRRLAQARKVEPESRKLIKREE